MVFVAVFAGVSVAAGPKLINDALNTRYWYSNDKDISDALRLLCNFFSGITEKDLHLRAVLSVGGWYNTWVSVMYTVAFEPRPQLPRLVAVTACVYS